MRDMSMNKLILNNQVILIYVIIKKSVVSDLFIFICDIKKVLMHFLNLEYYNIFNFKTINLKLTISGK